MNAADQSYDAAIIGSGLGGLCAAVRLKRAGLRVIVFERASEVGGVWRDNTYPGCAVDTSILSYSLSFDPNPGWSRLYAPSTELLSYLRGVAAKHEIREHIRFESTVTELRYDEGDNVWKVSTGNGIAVKARFVVNACGLLSTPQAPPIPGLDTFQGAAFHSATWDHSVDLTGKRVAVIGTGASAAQVIPAIVDRVGHMTVFQRSAAWVFPRNDSPISDSENRLYRALPFVLKIRRWIRFVQNDRVQYGFSRKDKTLAKQERWARAHLEAQVADPELRKRLTPDYSVGCKRRVMSDEYYPALQKSHVGVVTQRVVEMRPTSLVDAEGNEHEVDVVIFGTGFAATEFLPETKVFGLKGVELHDAWADGAATHKSLTVSGFPNLFMVNGPNTGIGAGSAAFMVECQVRYVLAAIRRLRRSKAAAFNLRPEVQSASYARLQERLAVSVYGSGCEGWYQQGPKGRIDTVFPGALTEYWIKTKRFDSKAYQFL